MLAAVKGIVQGNTVVIEEDDIRDYDGAEVIELSKEKSEKSTC